KCRGRRPRDACQRTLPAGPPGHRSYLGPPRRGSCRRVPRLPICCAPTYLPSAPSGLGECCGPAPATAPWSARPPTRYSTAGHSPPSHQVRWPGRRRHCRALCRRDQPPPDPWPPPVLPRPPWWPIELSARAHRSRRRLIPPATAPGGRRRHGRRCVTLEGPPQRSLLIQVHGPPLHLSFGHPTLNELKNYPPAATTFASRSRPSARSSSPRAQLSRKKPGAPNASPGTTAIFIDSSNVAAKCAEVVATCPSSGRLSRP